MDEATLHKLLQAGRVDPLTQVRLQRGKEWSTLGKLLPHLIAQPEGSAAAPGSIPWGRWELERSAPAKPGSVAVTPNWVNSLGMPFVPVPGTKVLFCIWHTRVQDYDAFTKATRRESEKVWFPQQPTHPAVKVSWDDAASFCQWLTGQERSLGVLSTNACYRLPQDWEWSVAVGLQERRASKPCDKHQTIQGIYPWGTAWPPPYAAGNYEQSLKVDDYRYTSPVGTFAANAFGLYDMGGNAWQWCEDWYARSYDRCRVARGGSCYEREEERLLASCRANMYPQYRYVDYGFRVVLAGTLQ